MTANTMTEGSRKGVCFLGECDRKYRKKVYVAYFSVLNSFGYAANVHIQYHVHVRNTDVVFCAPGCGTPSSRNAILITAAVTTFKSPTRPLVDWTFTGPSAETAALSAAPTLCAPLPLCHGCREARRGRG